MAKCSFSLSDLNFRILGAQHTIEVEIYSASGEIVDQISPPGVSDDYPTLWQLPDDLEPGTYTITASDGLHSANATYVYDG